MEKKKKSERVSIVKSKEKERGCQGLGTESSLVRMGLFAGVYLRVRWW